MKNVLMIIVGALLVMGPPVTRHNRCAAADSPPKAAARTRADIVMISIRPNVQTDSKVIRLADVATITGGDAQFREQLKQLDLDDGVSPGESIMILPPQIEFRLRIAGVDVERVSIRGNGVRVQARSGFAKEADVVTHAAAMTTGPKTRRAVDFSSNSVDEGPLEHDVILAARNCVLGKLPWSADKVDIRLSQPISPEVRQISSSAGYDCAAEMRTTGPALGRIQLRVIASAPDKPTFDIPVLLEVRHFDQVVLTTKSFERGHILTAADLYVDRQDVTDFTDYCSSTKEIIGSSVKRSLRALLPIRQGDVEAANRSDNGIVIKRREQVKMLAKAGGLVVSATGEALEDGRIGESIRLRNTVSNANVQGRVIGQGEVEISY